MNIHPLYIIFSSDLLNYKQNGTKENIVHCISGLLVGKLKREKPKNLCM